MKGGARTTVEAIGGLVLHPKDSLQDFKDFFTELGKIYNNGDVGNGLRTHGIAATTLAIKYLPLAGVPGVAAATALEKLEINKWIKILASLIDFVAGKGNLMDFLNALKELVGDIFNLLKDIITDVITHPEKVVEGVKSLFKPGGVLTTVGDNIVDIFKPGYAAEQANAVREQESIKSEDNNLHQMIALVLEDAKTQFAEAPPKDFTDAVRAFMIPRKGSPAVVAGMGSFEEQGLTRIPERSPEVDEAFKEWNDLYKDPASHSSGPTWDMIQGRLGATYEFYTIPFWMYLRKTWPDRPDVYKNVKLPPIPDWSEAEFADKIMLGGHPTYGGPRPETEYETFKNKWIKAADDLNPINEYFIERRKEEMTNILAEQEARQQKFMEEAQPSADYVASGPDRQKTFRKDTARQIGFPITESLEGELPAVPFTYEDWVADGQLASPFYPTDGGPSRPRTADEIKKIVDAAKPSHKNIANYMYYLMVAVSNTEGDNPSFQNVRDSYKPILAAQTNFILKKPGGIAAVKDLLDKNGMTATYGQALSPYQKQYLEEMLATAKPKTATAPAMPAMPGMPALPQLPAVTLPPLTSVPATGSRALTGSGMHTFHHLDQAAGRNGKRPRHDRLDPFFFEGTM